MATVKNSGLEESLPAEDDCEESWAPEIERRIERHLRGESTSKPWPEVRDRALDRIRSRLPSQQ